MEEFIDKYVKATIKTNDKLKDTDYDRLYNGLLKMFKKGTK